MKVAKFIIIIVCLAQHFDIKACSFFCAARNGQVLMAGNEDWHDPFSKLWTRPGTKDTFGIIYLGHSDYQAQIGINEYGLAFDFAAIDRVVGLNTMNKPNFYGDLFSEILAKCKTVDEALVYLNKYKFHTPFSQALIADALGNSILINQDAIVKRTADYQISTNFNACDIASKNYECLQYDIIDESLSKRTPISVDAFRNLLSRVHQEGSNPTQFSYVFDLKKGELYIYAFHNYENVVKLNVKEELSKGFVLKDLKELFPPTYEENYFRTHHKDSLKQSLLKTVWNTEAVDALKLYSAMKRKKPAIADYPFMLWELGVDIVKEIWVRESKGKPFDYWWSPKNYTSWKSNNPKLKEALKIFTFLENIPKDDPKQQIGAYEMKGVIFYVLGEKGKAKDYFSKTLSVSPKNIANYKRAKFFYDYLNTQNIQNQKVPLKKMSYKVALQNWKSIKDIHDWISVNFKYDFERAKLLSNNSKKRVRETIYKPGELYNIKKGMCVDLSRFAFETIKAIEPDTNVKYLKIKFKPLVIEGSSFIYHWLICYKRGNKYYFLADSNRPKILAGPYNSVDDFMANYEKFRKREVESFSLLDTYKRKYKLKVKRKTN